MKSPRNGRGGLLRQRLSRAAGDDRRAQSVVEFANDMRCQGSALQRWLPPFAARNSLIMQAEILAYQISSTWSRGTRLRFADAGGKSSCAAVSPTYDRSGERLLLSNYLMERSQSRAGSHVRYG